ncbi:MAG: tetratricopeptide repeat protein [Deltaproteobacteria bacterium]|nr:MAG: tetratricopeptide repeat protein [Deltaproteobacteria bacterium]
MKRSLVFVLLCSLALALTTGCEKVNERRARRIAKKAVKMYNDSQYNSARSMLREAIRLNPNDGHSRYLLGRVYEALRNPSAAIQEYERSVYLDSSNYRPHFHMGDIYYKSKQFPKAIIHYEKVVALKPNHLFSLYHLGLSLHKMRKFQRAETMFTKAIAIKSSFVEAYNGLAATYLDQAEQALLQAGADQAEPYYQKAVTTIQNAVSKGIATPQSYNLLGLIYQKQKKFEQAIRSFRKAMKKLSLAAYNLGVTYDAWLEELLNQAKQEKDREKRLEIMKEADKRRRQAMDAFKDYLQLSRSDETMRLQIRTKIHKLRKMVFEDNWKKLVSKRRYRRRRRRRR